MVVVRLQISMATATATATATSTCGRACLGSATIICHI
jgi:hypothetical protein